MKGLLFFIYFITISITLYSEEELFRKAQTLENPEEIKVFISKYLKSNDSHKEFALGIAYHNLCLIDSRIENITNAIKYLESYYNKTKSSLALAYYGSAITLLADYANKKKDVITATAKLEEGLKLIDKAVSISPDDIDIRILRLNNNIGVIESSPFDRKNVLEEDLKYLKENFSKLSQPYKTMYYFISGKLALFKKDIDSAINFLELAIKNEPASNLAKKAKKILLELEE